MLSYHISYEFLKIPLFRYLLGVYTMFSVIIPYYQPYDHFFIDCLRSVLKQTFSDFECIVVVNENEGFNHLIEDKRVKVIYCKNNDQSSKRNAGIEVSRNKYIIFLDCDDMIDIHYLEKSHYIINSCHPDLIIFGYTRNYDDIGSYANNGVFLDCKQKCMENIYADFMCKSPNVPAFYDSVWLKVFNLDLLKKNKIFFVPFLKCAEDSIFVRDYARFVNTMYINSEYKSYFWRNNIYSTMSRVDSGFYDLGLYLQSLLKIMEKVDVYYSKNINGYIVSIVEFRFEQLLSLFLRKKIGYHETVHTFKYMVNSSKFIKKAFTKSLLNTKKIRLMRFIISSKLYCFLYIVLLYLRIIYNKS